MAPSLIEGCPMKCPICDVESEELHAHNDNVKTIRCPECGTFDVSAQALATLPTLNYDEKTQALRYARTNALAGRFPFIHGLK